jgi:hypothetical protein
MLGTRDHNPILTFHIQSSLETSYPTFKGQTSTELLLAVKSRATLENRVDILKETDTQIEQTIKHMVDTGIVSTNVVYSFD